MSSYKELLQQKEELIARVEAARKAELASVIAEIKAKMEEHGITVNDLGANKKVSKASGSRKPVAAKYRDPATGVTWSGRGKPPLWIAGQDRDAFLINAV